MMMRRILLLLLSPSLALLLQCWFSAFNFSNAFITTATRRRYGANSSPPTYNTRNSFKQGRLFDIHATKSSSTSSQDPTRSVLNRAVLLYDQLASVQGTSGVVNQYLSDQLRTMIVSMTRLLRENDSTPMTSSTTMNAEQFQLVSAILDTIESQIVQQQQQQKQITEEEDADVEGWRALHRAAQLIERAILEKVPYPQVRALVESYASVKASLEQKQLAKQARERASFEALWKKVEPFLPPVPVTSSSTTAPATTARSSRETQQNILQETSQNPSVPMDATLEKQLEDFLSHKPKVNTEPTPQQLEEFLSHKPKENTEQTKRKRDDDPLKAQSPSVGRKGDSQPTPSRLPQMQTPPSPTELSTVSTPTRTFEEAVEERNRLAKQLEETLLSDVESADPVQFFVDSLKGNARENERADPPIPQSTVYPVPAPTPRAESAKTNTVSSTPAPPNVNMENPTIKRQREMAQKLEEALLAEATDDNTDPVEAFLRSIQGVERDMDQVKRPEITSSPSRLNQTETTNDRIEAFIQNLREIRNVSYTNIEPRPPIEKPSAELTQELARDLESTNYKNQEQEFMNEKIIRAYNEPNKGRQQTLATKTPRSPFYFANSTSGEPFFFAEPPSDTESTRKELKKMEINMLAYLDAALPAAERTAELARAVAKKAKPLVEKGASIALSSLGSVWVSVYSAAKSAAQRTMSEQARAQNSKKTRSSNNMQEHAESAKERSSRGALMELLMENILSSFDVEQFSGIFPNQENKKNGKVAEVSAEYPDDDRESVIFNENGGENGMSVSCESKLSKPVPSASDDTNTLDTAHVDAEPGRTLQELAIDWVQESKKLVDKSEFADQAGLADEAGAVTAGATNNSSDAGKIVGLPTVLNELTVSNADAESSERERIQALKKSLGFDIADIPSETKEMVRPDEYKSRNFEDVLASLRMKLSQIDSKELSDPWANIEDATNDEQVLGKDTQCLSPRSKNEREHLNLISETFDGETSQSLNNPERLANEWKIRNQDSNSIISQSYSHKSNRQDRISFDSGNSKITDNKATEIRIDSPNWVELSDAWKMRNSDGEYERSEAGTEYMARQRNFISNGDFGESGAGFDDLDNHHGDEWEHLETGVQASHCSKPGIDSNRTPPDWTSLANEWAARNRDVESKAATSPFKTFTALDTAEAPDSDFEKLAKEWILRNRGD